MIKSSVTKQILMYIPGNIIPLLLNLLASAIFTRIFDANEYGNYCLVISLIALITVLSCQWLQQSINRFLPGLNDRDDISALKSIIAYGLLSIAMIQTILFLVCLPFVLTYLSNQWISFYYSAFFSIVSFSIFTPLTIIFQAELNPKPYSYYNSINALFKFAISFFIVITFYKNPNGLLWGYGFSYALLIPLIWHHTKLPLPLTAIREVRTINSSYSIGMFLSYGGPMILWFLASTLLSIGDRYIIQYFRGAEEVGIYSASYNLIFGGIGLVTMPIQLAAHPLLVKAWEQGNKELTSSWLKFISEWIITIGLLVVGFLYIFSSDFASWLLGPRFREGHIIMPIVCAGLLFWQLGTYAHKPLEFVKNTKLMMRYCLIAAAVNIVLNIILVPIYGYIAAAITTVVSYAVYNILIFRKSHEILRWKFDIKKNIVNITLIFCGVLIIASVRIYISSYCSYISTLMTSVIMYSALFMLIMYINNYIGFIKSSVAARSSS